MTQKPLVLFAAGSLLIVGVILGFFLWQPGPVELQPEDVPVPTATPGAQERDAFAKQIVDCAQLADEVIGVSYTEGIEPPAQLPRPPAFGRYCGAVTETDGYYYIGSQEDQIILDYYREALEQTRCTTTGSQQAPSNRLYSYALPFSCPYGQGVVAVFAQVAAFVVTLQ